MLLTAPILLNDSLPRWGRAVGLLPGNAPPWGDLGGNGHLVAPSTTSMRQRGRRWRELDHRWSPAGTTDSLIHLRDGRERESDSVKSEHSFAREKHWHRQTWLPREDRLYLFRMLNEKEKKHYSLITEDLSKCINNWWWGGAKIEHRSTKIQNSLLNLKLLAGSLTESFCDK